MAHYNRLSEVVYDEKLTCRRFRVKILRIYPFNSYITGSGPHWVYVLADEDGTKMEMTIYDVYGDRYRGLEKQEGKWVEIFRVEVDHAYSGFNGAKSPFRLTSMSDTQVHIIDPLNNRLYFDFKSIHEIPHISNMDRNYPMDIMGVLFNTEAHCDNPERPKMVFYIRDNIESQIKCVATGHHAYAFREGFQNRGGRGEVIVVLKMWRLETEGGLSDFRFNSLLPEVEEFMQSLLRSDTYVQRHGAIGPL
uniref:Replication protein A 70 kDa DNA-binding subunit B/D first OB fold domain-containing protein n=1 Tax=Brassica oleracea var. oleracea TaxID=109376 RepID=A0A0D2ZR08_BRAOL